MPGIIENEFGKITIAEDIVATLVGYAAGENYGIVGMNSKKASDTILQLVGTTNHKRGVKVTVVEDGTVMDIDLYITVVYGVSLPAVAKNAMENVRYRVEDLTGLKVRNVNVHIEGIRL